MSAPSPVSFLSGSGGLGSFAPLLVVDFVRFLFSSFVLSALLAGLGWTCFTLEFGAGTAGWKRCQALEILVLPFSFPSFALYHAPFSSTFLSLSRPQRDISFLLSPLATRWLTITDMVVLARGKGELQYDYDGMMLSV